jgi:hypothetical protein
VAQSRQVLPCTAAFLEARTLRRIDSAQRRRMAVPPIIASTNSLEPL